MKMITDKQDWLTFGGSGTAVGSGGVGYVMTSENIYLLIAVAGFAISVWAAWQKRQEHKQRKNNEILEREILLQRQRDDAERMIMSKERHSAIMAALKGDRNALGNSSIPNDAAQRMNDILDEVGG